MMRAMQNPQQLLNYMIQNGQAMTDPRARRAVDLLQRHDTAGLKRMAENLCSEYGITTDDARAQVYKAFGMQGNPGP